MLKKEFYVLFAQQKITDLHFLLAKWVKAPLVIICYYNSVSIFYIQMCKMFVCHNSSLVQRVCIGGTKAGKIKKNRISMATLKLLSLRVNNTSSCRVLLPHASYLTSRLASRCGMSVVALWWNMEWNNMIWLGEIHLTSPGLEKTISQPPDEIYKILLVAFLAPICEVHMWILALQQQKLRKEFKVTDHWTVFLRGRRAR